MANLWYHGFHRICNRIYFARVTVLHPERLPKTGPVMYLGLHRNGAVDGFIYHALLPRAVFLISTQLRRNPLGRLFFSGIEVVRDKDKGQSGNDPDTNVEALKCCRELLRSGGELFIFPEGTSSLGPRHLPFKSGAARLLLDSLSASKPIQVIPLGIHYECAWAFRSKVEVVVGRPIGVVLPAALRPLERIKEMKRRIQFALEEVGINVTSPEYQETIQRLAYVATLATPRSYFKTLKALEKSIPEKILQASRALEPELRTRKLLCHQGVPLFPMGPVSLYLLALVVLAPLVIIGAWFNLPPILAAWWAGKKVSDDSNVISLWRILVGLPLFVSWALLVMVVAMVLGKWAWLAVYVAATGAALKLYYRVKKLAVTVHNGLRYRELRAPLLAFRETVLESLPDEN